MTCSIRFRRGPLQKYTAQELTMNTFILTSKMYWRYIITTALVTISLSSAWGFSITKDPNTENFKLEYFSDDLGKNVEVIFEPPTKINPSVKPAITLQGAEFTYSYVIDSAVSSRQSILSFRIIMRSTPRSFLSPTGWFAYSPSPNNPSFRWAGSKRLGGQLIAPGSSLGGFQMRSDFLPGIVDIRFRGSIQQSL